jgi:hypothetical protein
MPDWWEKLYFGANVAAAADADELEFQQDLDHVIHIHAAHRLDVRTRDRLAIRDDGQRLERGSGQSLRTHGNLGALDGFGEFGAREDLPAASLLDQFDAMSIDAIEDMVDAVIARELKLIVWLGAPLGAALGILQAVAR